MSRFFLAIALTYGLLGSMIHPVKGVDGGRVKRGFPLGAIESYSQAHSLVVLAVQSIDIGACYRDYGGISIYLGRRV
jgi:hypothetical protein